MWGGVLRLLLVWLYELHVVGIPIDVFLQLLAIEFTKNPLIEIKFPYSESKYTSVEYYTYL